MIGILPPNVENAQERKELLKTLWQNRFGVMFARITILA
jgi:hypothetical protein